MFFQFSKQYTKPFWCYDYVKRAPQKLLFANFSKLKREGYNFGGRCNASEHIGTLSTYLTIGSTFFEFVLIIFFFPFTTPRGIPQSFTLYDHGVNKYRKKSQFWYYNDGEYNAIEKSQITLAPAHWPWPTLKGMSFFF